MDVNPFGTMMQPVIMIGLLLLAFFSLLTLISIILIVPERIAVAKEHQRNWFQVSLLSILLLTLVTGAWVAANTIVHDPPVDLPSWSVKCRGYPFPYMDVGKEI